MWIKQLHVIHLPKGSASLGADQNLEIKARLEKAYPHALSLDTCQRSIWVIESSNLGLTPELSLKIETFSSTDAYEFLLRVATGLESELKGETNIFGQIKEAWGHELCCRPWLQKLFEDTKEIRSRHLGNLGSVSYGSLTRKLLKTKLLSENSKKPVLIVGAGDIATSVAPWLTDQEIWISNRSPERAEALKLEILLKDPKAQVSVVTYEPTEEIYSQVGAIIYCIPYTAQEDLHRIETYRRSLERTKNPPLLLHLGGFAAEAGAWNTLSHELFLALDDLLSMQDEQGGIRSKQLERAYKACQERSTLRILGTSTSIAHGWEDLAYFS